MATRKRVDRLMMLSRRLQSIRASKDLAPETPVAARVAITLHLNWFLGTILAFVTLAYVATHLVTANVIQYDPDTDPCGEVDADA